MIAPMFSSSATDGGGEGEGGDWGGDSDSCFVRPSVRLLAGIDGGVTRPGQTVTTAAAAMAMAAERTPETQRSRGL